MGKKILLLTAGKTGGHRSASTAVKAALLAKDPTLEVIDYDSNRLFLGYGGEGGEQGYVTMTTRLRFFWKVFFEFTSFFRPVSNFFLSAAIKHRFLALLNEEKPDLVVSLHPCFVDSAIQLVRKTWNVPFYVVLLDPMKHSRLWRSKKADLTFLPTIEAKNSFIKAGFAEEKLILSGFPVSLRQGGQSNDHNPRLRKRLLFVNPSQRGFRHTLKLIETAYPFDVDIDIVTGSDTRLRLYMEKHLPPREGVNVLGYVNDMGKRLLEADILLTKAGPNVMFEAIAAKTPIVFTGHLPGQEETNALYAVSRGYAYEAEKPGELRKTLVRLIVDDPAELERMTQREADCPDVNGAQNIAMEIVSRLGKEGAS